MKKGGARGDLNLAAFRLLKKEFRFKSPSISGWVSDGVKSRKATPSAGISSSSISDRGSRRVASVSEGVENVKARVQFTTAGVLIDTSTMHRSTRRLLVF